MRVWIILAGVLMATTAGAKDRFPTLAPEQMTPAQKAVADEIMSGPRKTLGGPFNAWLRSPEMADRMQKVGEQIRFHSSVPRKLNEFAILITARAWNAKYEWYAHYPLALQAGLEPAVAADLAQGRRPRGMSPTRPRSTTSPPSCGGTGRSVTPPSPPPRRCWATRG